MIAVKILKRLLMGASHGPKHQSTCRPIFDIYSVNKLGLRHRLGETKPLINLIAGVILRLRRRKKVGEGWGRSKGEG